MKHCRFLYSLLFFSIASFATPLFASALLSNNEVSSQEQTTTKATPLPQASPKASPSPKKTITDMGLIAATVARILEQGHFLRLPLNAPNPPHDEATPALSLPERVMKNYLQTLDYSHLYFTQADVDEFQKTYGSTLTTNLLRGDLTAPRAIYQRFLQRVEDRVKKIQPLIKDKYSFSSNRAAEINRQKSPWPKNEAEADELWKNRIEAELLQEHLSKHPIKPPAEIVKHRYDQMLKYLHEQTDEDTIKFFLTALSESYDPHSEYMSPTDMENFNIQMKLSLVGIGALLRSDDGYTKIVEIMPGGPADRDRRLQANDRIVAVAQDDGPFEDIMDLRIDKVVQKIRGKKGTKVRLQVIPAAATDPSKRVIIELVRDEVKLKESESKAEMIEVKGKNGNIEKYGWLTIPSFYAEMGHQGPLPGKSTTEDVQCLLTRLKKENIQGLVIDLRRNGGGSLDEAIKLTGLFIGAGPVVQAKDANGKISVFTNNATTPFYDGPIVVLCNRLSASASEIFAAALQDYHRAVIVGDHQSFGKGTVQTLLDVGRFMPLFKESEKAGTIKLTIQKFYRVSGGSTQHRGVHPDIILPSMTDTPDISEAMLPNPLVYDEVDPLSFHQFSKELLFLNTLQEHSHERVSKDLEFRYISENMKKLRDRLAKNQLSLNKKVRNQELGDEKKETAQHKAESSVLPQPSFVEYELTLDTVNQPILPKVDPKKKKKETDSKAKKAKDPDDDDDESEFDDSNNVDPQKREAIEIVQDLSTLIQSSHIVDQPTTFRAY